jgi:hypothetical protein
MYVKPTLYSLLQHVYISEKLWRVSLAYGLGCFEVCVIKFAYENLILIIVVEKLRTL